MNRREETTQEWNRSFWRAIFCEFPRLPGTWRQAEEVREHVLHRQRVTFQFISSTMLYNAMAKEFSTLRHCALEWRVPHVDLYKSERKSIPFCQLTSFALLGSDSCHCEGGGSDVNICISFRRPIQLTNEICPIARKVADGPASQINTCPAIVLSRRTALCKRMYRDAEYSVKGCLHETGTALGRVEPSLAI